MLGQSKSSNQTYAVLPLRDIVVFPHMIVPLFVGRDKSVQALEHVMHENKQILLLTQKSPSEDDPQKFAAPVSGSNKTTNLLRQTS